LNYNNKKAMLMKKNYNFRLDTELMTRFLLTVRATGKKIGPSIEDLISQFLKDRTVGDIRVYDDKIIVIDQDEMTWEIVTKGYEELLTREEWAEDKILQQFDHASREAILNAIGIHVGFVVNWLRPLIGRTMAAIKIETGEKPEWIPDYFIHPRFADETYPQVKHPLTGDLPADAKEALAIFESKGARGPHHQNIISAGGRWFFLTT